MESLSHPTATVNTERRYIRATLRTEGLRTVESARFSGRSQLAAWLAKHGAKYHGRAGFSVERHGERCWLLAATVVDGRAAYWTWKALAELAPEVERAARLSSLPVVRPARRRA